MLRTDQKIYYASCRFGTSILLNMVQVASFWIYDKHFQLDPLLNGFGNGFGKLVIALSGFAFGYISDIMPPTRYGRRKIFMAIGAPGLALSFFMLFLPHLFIPLNAHLIVFAWLLLWNSAFNFFYGFLLTPYQAWMPEITAPEERVPLSGYQNTFNLLASIIGFGFSFFLAGYLTETGGITGPGGKFILIAVIIFSLIEVLGFLPTILFIKEPQIQPVQRDLLSEIKVVLWNKNYFIWLLAEGVASIGIILVTTLALNYIQDVLGFTSTLQFVIFGACLFGGVMVAFPIWGKIAAIIGKRRALIIGFIWFTATLPLSVIVGKVPGIPYDHQGYLYGLTLAFGLASYYIFRYAIVADIAAHDELQTNEARAGMYTGFDSIPLNFLQFLGIVLAGVLKNTKQVTLGFLGTYSGLALLGPVCAFFILLSIPIIYLGDFDPFMQKAQVKTVENVSN